MIDFELIDGDLSFVDETELETTEDEISIIRRAIQTPSGRLAMPEFGRQGFIRDEEFGNEIYNELSEPFSPGFLAAARQHCQDAADLVSQNVQVGEPVVFISDSHTITIELQHNLNTDPFRVTV